MKNQNTKSPDMKNYTILQNPDKKYIQKMAIKTTEGTLWGTL